MSPIAVNDVITAVRLPHRFYAMIHHLEGRDAHYQNPGVSLLSYIIAHCLLKEFVTLDGQLEESYRQCIEFNNDVKILSVIHESLGKQAADLAAQIGQLRGQARMNCMHYIQDMQALLNEAHAALQSLIKLLAKSDATKELDAVLDQEISFRRASCDLQDKIAETAALLEDYIHDPEVA